MTDKTRNNLPYREETIKLTLNTHVPTKWLAVDTETGDAWQGTPEGNWTRFRGTVGNALSTSDLLSEALKQLDPINDRTLIEKIAGYLRGD